MYLSLATRKSRRPGKVLALFALALPALLGMMAIVVDGAMGLSFHRQLQNAADNAAKAAALRLFQDWHLPQAQREANATQVANAFIQTHHGYTRGAPQITFGAAMGEPRYNRPQDLEYYVKVTLSHTVDTWFAHIFGANRTTVYVEAIAGFEHPDDPARWPEYREGVITLDPRATTATTGIVMGSNSRLTVNGSVVVNARGRGFDQYQSDVDYGFSSQALTIPNSALLTAHYVQVRGGVERPELMRDFRDPRQRQLAPFFGRAGIVPDPLATSRAPFRYLPIPIDNRNRSWIEVGPGFPQTLDPGVWDDIWVRSGGQVTFRSGIYVLRPGGYDEYPQGLRIEGGAQVRATGPVMFYFTTTLYNDNPSDPDQLDRRDGAVDYNYAAEQIPPLTGLNPKIAILDIDLTRTDIQLEGLPLNHPNWPGVLFFLRRNSVGIVQPSQPPYNDEANRFRIYGTQTASSYLRGAIYAKWGTLNLGGTATYSPGQFVVGSLKLQDNANITVTNTPANRYTARKTFLVQ